MASSKLVIFEQKMVNHFDIICNVSVKLINDFKL